MIQEQLLVSALFFFLMIDCGRTRCFKSPDIVARASDGEKINYNTIEIDGQLNVSSPQRVVIAHCSLIEGARGEREAGPPRTPVEDQVVPSALTQQTQRSVKTLIIHLGAAKAKPNSQRGIRSTEHVHPCRLLASCLKCIHCFLENTYINILRKH